MKWTSYEARFANAIAVFFGLNLAETMPVGIQPRTSQGRQETLARTLRFDRDYEGDTDDRLSPTVSLSSFAQLNEIDTNDEFWGLKALLLVVQQHPHFVTRVDKKLAHRPRVPKPVRDADLYEWSI